MVSDFSIHRARFRFGDEFVEYWTKIIDNQVFVKGKKFFGLLPDWRFLSPYTDAFRQFRDLNELDDSTLERTGLVIREYPIDIKNSLKVDHSLLNPRKELELNNAVLAENLSHNKLLQAERLIDTINNRSLFEKELKHNSDLVRGLNPYTGFAGKDDKNKKSSTGGVK